MNVRDELQRFISEEILEFDEPVEPDENLLADGMVDSLGMLRLIGFIEVTWSYKVPPEDFVVANFRTIQALDTYLAERLEHNA